MVPLKADAGLPPPRTVGRFVLEDGEVEEEDEEKKTRRKREDFVKVRYDYDQMIAFSFSAGIHHSAKSPSASILSI